MTDVYVAYDQTLDSYLPVRLQEGTWTYVHGLEEDTFDDLPALTGKDRYRALADVYEVDRELAVKRATRAMKRYTKTMKRWEAELEVFAAAAEIRHVEKEVALQRISDAGVEFIETLMRDPKNDKRDKRYV